MKYDFSNTQIKLPDDISKNILEKGHKLVSPSALFGPKGYETDPHVTVLYGIHSPLVPLQIIDIIETHPKFLIRLGKLTLFKGKENDNDFDVVKLDVTSPDLHYLNKAFQENCECTVSYPTYKPHMTIAYVKQDSCDHLEGINIFDGISFIADSIHFSNKNGEKRDIKLGRR